MSDTDRFCDSILLITNCFSLISLLPDLREAWETSAFLQEAQNMEESLFLGAGFGVLLAFIPICTIVMHVCAWKVTLVLSNSL